MGEHVWGCPTLQDLVTQEIVEVSFLAWLAFLEVPAKQALSADIYFH